MSNISIIASGSEFQMWQRITKFEDDSGTVISYSYEIPSAILFEQVNNKLYQIITEYNPNFRSRFYEINQTLYKVSSACATIVLERVQVDKVTNRLEKNWTRLYPLDGILYRFVWVELPNKRLLYLSFSHLIFDGSGYRDLCQWISSIDSENIQSNKSIDLTPISLTTLDVTQNDKAYWQQYIRNKPLGTKFPFFKKTTQRGEFIRLRRQLSGDILTNIQSIIKQYGVNIFQFILATSALTVLKYQCLVDTPKGIMLAYPVNLRGTNKEVGCYFNTVPCWVDYDENDTGQAFFDKIKLDRLNTKKHQHVFIKDIISYADEQINRDIHPFNFIINFSEGMVPLSGIILDQQHCLPIYSAKPDGPFDFVISFNIDDKQLVITFDVDEYASNIKQLNDFYHHWLYVCQWLSDATQPLKLLTLTRSFLPILKGRALPILKTDSIVGQIVNWQTIIPNHTAVIYEQTKLTYRELVMQANLMTVNLLSRLQGDTKPVIGFYLNRSSYLPSLMLACLSLESPFLPIIRELPTQGLVDIVKQAALKFLITDTPEAAKQILAILPTLNVMVLSELLTDNQGINEALPLPTVSHEKHAYWICTSGSTGKPKIVMLSQQSLYNFLVSMRDKPGLFSGDRLLALSAISFDIAILELLLPIFCGATVDIADDTVRKQATELASYIEHNPDITVVQATPSTWQMLMSIHWQASHKLRIFVGGEALDSQVADYLLTQGHQLYNMYGPTEATIWASSTQITTSQPITLGLPTDNTKFYVVDDDFKSVPIGIPGQLIIAGEPVAQGYFNQTTNNFITINDERCYATGDRVFFSGEKQLFYLERMDKQVKIRGHRVELLEINHYLQKIAPNATWVTVLGSKPEPHLRSFFVSEQGNHYKPAELTKKLAILLPNYKIPQIICELTTFPINVNGKKDLKKLADEMIHHLPIQTTDLPSQAEEKIKSQEEEYKHDGLTVLKQIIKDTLNIDVGDITTPLGWYGLNSISFNKLAEVLSQYYQVKLLPHQLIGEVSLGSLYERIKSTQLKVVLQPKKQITHIDNNSDIAIVGMYCCLPDNTDAQGFWRGLLEGKNWITSHDRPYLDTNIRAGFIKDIDKFDPLFFHITPREAHDMDPRQRLLLQGAWKALEDAGYSKESLRSSLTGCYIAASGMDYLLTQLQQGVTSRAHTLAGTSLGIIANRISNFFDWKGPSHVYDTACSSSLTAVIRAVQDLRSGNCEQALVAGANLILNNVINDSLIAGGYLSKKNHCAAFDEEGDGYIRGEGVVCLILKPIKAALSAGDHIYAVIKEGLERHGGQAPSLSTPKAAEQGLLMQSLYHKELIANISYIETHGTGTRLGDPIEVEGLKMAWNYFFHGKYPQTVYLGALKRNIGHLEAAAGLASIIKVILAMQHKVLPLNRPISQKNSFIDFNETPFSLLDDTCVWESDGLRTAGISGFNFGGNNAHLILSEFKQDIDSSCVELQPYLFTLSAQSVYSLAQIKQSLIEYLTICPIDGQHFANLSFTLCMGRDQMKYREAWIAVDVEDLIKQMGSPSSRPITAMENLKSLYEHYLAGELVDFSKLYANRIYRRLSLPTYCFNEQGYWFNKKPENNTYKKGTI